MRHQVVLTVLVILFLLSYKVFDCLGFFWHSVLVKLLRASRRSHVDGPAGKHKGWLVSCHDAQLGAHHQCRQHLRGSVYVQLYTISAWWNALSQNLHQLWDKWIIKFHRMILAQTLFSYYTKLVLYTIWRQQNTSGKAFGWCNHWRGTRYQKVTHENVKETVPLSHRRGMRISCEYWAPLKIAQKSLVYQQDHAYGVWLSVEHHRQLYSDPRSSGPHQFVFKWKFSNDDSRTSR